MGFKVKPSNKKIIAIGTVHIDPFIESRLEAAIARHRPKQITLEVMKSQIDTPKNPMWLASLVTDFIKIFPADGPHIDAFIEAARPYGAEIYKVREIAARYGIPIHPVDSKHTRSDMPPKGIEEEFELMKSKRIEVTEKQEQFYRRLYELEDILGLKRKVDRSTRDRFLFATTLSVTPKEEWEEVIDFTYYMTRISITKDGMRDARQADRILKVWNTTDGNIMHIGGASHLFSTGYNVYEWLVDFGLNIERKMLGMYDKNYSANKTPL